ncbi:hypothetical protein BDZ89DRAFT_1129613 [Hymenopellis radicata]|nr:hypothetical protein BDZ89DRAFT_1129613 [Hymenopellis radicata]
MVNEECDGMVNEECDGQLEKQALRHSWVWLIDLDTWEDNDSKGDNMSSSENMPAGTSTSTSPFISSNRFFTAASSSRLNSSSSAPSSLFFLDSEGEDNDNDFILHFDTSAAASTSQDTAPTPEAMAYTSQAGPSTYTSSLGGPAPTKSNPWLRKL